MRAPRRPSGGFTFVEMMVVIFVLGLATAIAVVNMEGMSSRSELSAAARDLGNKLLFLRDLAIVQARDMSLEIDLENSRWRTVDRPSETDVPDDAEREEDTYYGQWYTAPSGVVLDEIAFGRADTETADVFEVTYAPSGELSPSGFVAYLHHDQLSPDDGLSVEVSGLTGNVAYHHGKIEAEEVREESDF